MFFFYYINPSSPRPMVVWKRMQREKKNTEEKDKKSAKKDKKSAKKEV